MALKRTRDKMPDFIRDVLSERSLMDTSRARPVHQQNDYIIISEPLLGIYTVRL